MVYLLNKYFKMETDLIIYFKKFNTWIICHILCVKRYIYSNNNLFRTNLERFIITTEVPTGMSVRPLNHILCCFNSSTNWEFVQMGRSLKLNVGYIIIAIFDFDFVRTA